MDRTQREGLGRGLVPNSVAFSRAEGKKKKKMCRNAELWFLGNEWQNDLWDRRLPTDARVPV